jgi:hypothetical protein
MQAKNSWLLLGAAALLGLAVAGEAAPRNITWRGYYVAPSEVGNRGFFTRTAGHTPAQEDAKWTKLYNEKDLTGWHVKDGSAAAWQAKGQMLACMRAGGGWLTSDKTYSDFELKLEFKIPPGGNSGVGLRYPAVGDPAHVGMEIQILDDPAPEYKNLQAAQYTGGIYYQVPPKAHPSKKPGEWNLYEIRCKGDNVYIKLNGVEIQNANMSDYKTGLGGHMALADRPRSGYVGLQSHTDEVDFRNIYIRELK